MKRLKHIDNARGVLILLVVLGHCFGRDDRMRFFYVFHVPAFFLISGYLFRKSSALLIPLKNNAEKIFRHLIIPLLFFEVIGGICNIILLDKPVYEVFFKFVTLRFNIGANWFLLSLFIAELIFIILQKHVKNTQITIAFVSALMITVFFMPKNQFFFIIGRVIVGLFFLMLGYYLPFIFEAQNRFIYLALALCITGVCSLYNSLVDVYCFDYGNPILFVIAAISGTFFLISICKYRVMNVFHFFGTNSMIIMGTHQILLPLISTFVLVKFLIIVMIETVLAVLITKLCPKLIGKA